MIKRNLLFGCVICFVALALIDSSVYAHSQKLACIVRNYTRQPITINVGKSPEIILPGHSKVKHIQFAQVGTYDTADTWKTLITGSTNGKPFSFTVAMGELHVDGAADDLPASYVSCNASPGTLFLSVLPCKYYSSTGISTFVFYPIYNKSL